MKIINCVLLINESIILFILNFFVIAIDIANFNLLLSLIVCTCCNVLFLLIAICR